MVYSFDGFNYLIRLDTGEILGKALETFVAQTKIEGAWLSGIGGAQQATLGFYDVNAKQYIWRDVDGSHEIVSLSGNIAFDEQGRMILHLHGVLADKDYQTIGGHLKDLVAGATVELFVHRAYQPTKRKLDKRVGLELLDL